MIPSGGKNVTVSSSYCLLEIWLKIFNLYTCIIFAKRESNKQINKITHIFFQLSSCYRIIT